MPEFIVVGPNSNSSRYAAARLESREIISSSMLIDDAYVTINDQWVTCNPTTREYTLTGTELKTSVDPGEVITFSMKQDNIDITKSITMPYPVIINKIPSETLLKWIKGELDDLKISWQRPKNEPKVHFGSDTQYILVVEFYNFENILDEYKIEENIRYNQTIDSYNLSRDDVPDELTQIRIYMLSCSIDYIGYLGNGAHFAIRAHTKSDDYVLDINLD